MQPEGTLRGRKLTNEVSVIRRMAARLGGIVATLAVTVAAATSPTPSETLPQRHRASITVEQAASFVRLPLTPQVYALSGAGLSELADVRVLDAAGQRVPFALLGPRADAVEQRQTWRDAKPWPLPPRAKSSDSLASPLQLSVEGGRLTVRPGGSTSAGAAKPMATAPGWLIDLGERTKDQAAPTQLQLQWAGPTEFSASFILEHSADLKQWAGAGSGQLMALASGGAALTQPDVALPAGVQRFVRLVWSGAGPWPSINGARVAMPAVQRTVLDTPHTLSVAPSAEPKGTHSDAHSQAPGAARALHFDMGAALPLVQLQLKLPGTRVMPAQVQVREREDERWMPLAGTVFYRLERAAASPAPAVAPAAAVGASSSAAGASGASNVTLASESPPLTLNRRVRYIRLLADERAGAQSAEGVHLQAQVQLASVVFAAQGKPPYALLVGAEKTEIGALPLTTLVPEAEQERERFGRASLGAFTEVAAAVAQARQDALKAQARPWLLWGVLLAGVAGLAFMVWRLMRGARADASAPTPAGGAGS